MPQRFTALCTASLLSVPAHAVSWSGSDGWEVHYTGFVNLFYNQLDFSPNDQGNGKDEDSSLLNEGLLPSFHTMKAKSPTVNGLTGTSQITFAIDTSTDKSVNLNKSGAGGDDLIDLREVFFNVEGSFGTISVGRTLALYQRQAILKDMTLFGVGGMADPDSNGTALGRIGAGYVYPDFRARFLWQSPDLHGFQVSLGVFQPRETYNGQELVQTQTFRDADGNVITGSLTRENLSVTTETDLPMFQGEMTFNLNQGGLEALFWGGFLYQESEVNIRGTATGSGQVSGTDTTGSITLTGNDDIHSFGWNVGTQMNFAGFGLTGSYYRGEGLGTLFFQPGGVGCQGVTGANITSRLERRTQGDRIVVGGTTNLACGEATMHGGYLQGTYTFEHGGDSKTMLGVSWGYSSVDNEPFVHGTNADVTYTNQGYTGGVYHDVNSWLKVVGEYNTYEYEETLGQEVEGFSIGAFMFW